MRWWAAAAALLVSGCGYHFSGHGEWPGEVHSVSIGTIGNQSREFGLERRLAFALESEFSRQGGVRLVESPGGADAVVQGTIRAVDLRPVAFNSDDDALQYEVAMVLDLRLVRNLDGKTVWHVDAFRLSEEYAAEAQVVVTSSSQFQQQTFDANDLNLLTDVELAESERRRALERLVKEVARNAYALMSEDF